MIHLEETCRWGDETYFRYGDFPLQMDQDDTEGGQLRRTAHVPSL